MELKIRSKANQRDVTKTFVDIEMISLNQNMLTKSSFPVFAKMYEMMSSTTPMEEPVLEMDALNQLAIHCIGDKQYQLVFKFVKNTLQLKEITYSY